MSNVVYLSRFLDTDPVEKTLGDAPFSCADNLERDPMSLSNELSFVTNLLCDSDETEFFFGCDMEHEYGELDLLKVLKSQNKVVRVSVATYEMKDGLELLEVLRRAS
jgi:hypothetical protein|tara:strand:- start:5 stop:325 length:321 start_codon:yes stop_codon:yes gene_type:complete